MTIIPQRKAKVPAAGCCIHGSLHAAERHHADGSLLRLSLKPGKQSLQLLRVHVAMAPAKLIAIDTDKIREPLHFLLLRYAVRSVDKRKAQPVKMLGDRFIGRNHEVLNHHGRFVPFIGHDLLHPALFIQMNLAFRKLKVNGAVRISLFRQNTGQASSSSKHRRQCVCSCLRPAMNSLQRKLLQNFRFILLRKKLHDARIGKLRIRSDDRFHNPCIHHISRLVHLHDAAQGKTILPRIQRADAVRKLMRQHRNDAVHEVIGGCSLQGLLIQCSVLKNILRNIRNMNAKLPHRRSVSFRCKPSDRNRIVDVLRVRAVNRDRRNIPEILPEFQNLLRYPDLLRNLPDLLHHFLRELLRKIVRTKDG